MHMMRTGNIFHGDDIDGKAVRLGQRLEDAAVANAAAFAIAQPAFGDAASARFGKLTERVAAGGIRIIQPVGQLAVERPAVESLRDARDQVLKFMWGHAGLQISASDRCTHVNACVSLRYLHDVAEKTRRRLLLDQYLAKINRSLGVCQAL
jgi:hypothetical protein